MNDSPAKGSFVAHAFDAALIRVVAGVNHGDTLAETEPGEPGDLYRITGQARPERLVLAGAHAREGRQKLAQGTRIGRVGDDLTLRRVLTLMAPNGDRVELLVIALSGTARLYAIPLSPMAQRMDYTLLAHSLPPADIRLADLICASFLDGTRLTMADGSLRAVGQLQPGDLLLTRDNGPQPLRWIGHAALNAAGPFAPVVISAGTLGNPADLVLGPHHRVFLYQRGGNRQGVAAEILVEARHLVNGDTVWRRDDGYCRFCALVFDRHEVIYAEGVPVESMMVNDMVLELLPRELAEDLKTRFPGLKQARHFAPDLDPGAATVIPAGRGPR